MTTILNRAQRRNAEKHIAHENTKYQAHMVLIPESEYATHQQSGMVSVWRSKDYLVQLFSSNHPGVCVRMSVNRTGIDSNGGWKSDIPWEDLQRIKNEIGFGDFDAVEVYPADNDVVNVANMRHLWVLNAPVEFAWRKK